MNITELRYLVAIMKWGSVSAAAKQLYAAQPNVSKALKNLEEEYGVRIFERSSTGMIPTEQGKRFIAQAQRVLQQVDELKQEAHQQRSCAELRVVLTHATYASYAAVDFLQQAARSEQLRAHIRESGAQRRKRAQLQSKPVYRYVALAIFVLGVAAAAYGLYSVFSHTGSYGVYFALFGFAAIFLFSSYNMLPTAHNNNNAIMKRADKAEAAMAEYVKHYPHGAFPVASWYAHPIVLKRMMDAIEEGNAVTVPEALDAVKARLKSLNADVQVEQEEYDEVVVIKAMFLNHDYQ